MLRLSVITPTCAGRHERLNRQQASLAREAWDEMFVVHDVIGNPAHARNRGLEASRMELIAFVDDDVIVDPGSLGRAKVWFETDPDLMLGQASVRGGFATDDAFMFLTTCMVIRRSWYEQIGPFDERFGYAKPCDDLEFGWRTLDAGGKVTFMTDVTAIHPEEGGSSWSPENVALMRTLYPTRWQRMMDEGSSWR